MSFPARTLLAAVFIITLVANATILNRSEPFGAGVTAATLPLASSILTNQIERARLTQLVTQVGPPKRQQRPLFNANLPGALSHTDLLHRAAIDDARRMLRLSNGIPGKAGLDKPRPFMMTRQESIPWSRSRLPQSSVERKPVTQVSDTFIRPRVAERLASSKRGAHPLVVTAGTQTFTGINHYWRYEGGKLPGVGRYMVNIGGAQNLVVQATDLDMPNKGIDLAFRRTYNSQSQHDYSGTDQSTISNYGDGWTNTYDAHAAYNTGNAQYGQGVTIYDIDGARYDYMPNAQTATTYAYQPPAGMAGTVVGVSGNFLCWVKKSGTQYCFYRPDYDTVVPGAAGYDGRLNVIFGRNSNAALRFSYTFDATPNTSQNLNTVTVTTEAGQAATLAFSDIKLAAAGTRRLLTTLTRQDGTKIGYAYDAFGNLSEVAEPINSSPQTSCVGGVSSCELTGYEYYMPGHAVLRIFGPRTQATNEYASSRTEFTYLSGFQSVKSIASVGAVNPSISDGYSSGAVQPGEPTAYATFRNITYAVSGSAVTLSDSDLHQTIYDANSTGDGTIIGFSNYVSPSLSLARTFGYDANFDLTWETDYRGNETDYRYDLNGNEVVEAQPSVANSDGTFRPLFTYSYDNHSNVVAYCDPEYNNSNNIQFGGSQLNGGEPMYSDTLCPQSTGAARMTWTPTSADINGELTAIETPLGYTRTIAYATSSQGGTDYGLPTSVTGTPITQSDGTTRTPTDTFTYDAFGNVSGFNKGNGNWALTYDALNRPLKTTDPDSIQDSLVTYYSDGSKQTEQNAVELANNVSTSYLYDADGNETSELKHAGCVPGGTTCSISPTRKWYDGDDRLIEVEKPSDSSDVNPFPWLTRYDYDLTMGGSVSFDSQQSYSAYGGLFKTQELLPARNETWQQGQSVSGSPSFIDSSGQSFDATDRPVVRFKVEIGLGSGDVIAKSVRVYDSSGQLGLLSSECNEVMQCAGHTYDARGLEVSKSFTSQGSQPVSANETDSYDSDGRVATRVQAGKGTWSYSYDPDGKLHSSVEPSFSKFTSPATLTYQYYASGERQAVAVSSSALSGNPLITYSYRADDRLQTEVLKAVTGSSAAFKISRVYSSAGRFNTQSESGTSTISQTPLSYTYDSYGRVTNIVMPFQNASVSQFEFEGSPTLGFLGSHGLNGAYTTRNEAFENFWSPSPSHFVLANGAQLPVAVENTCNSHTVTFDATQSAVLTSVAGAKKAADGTCPASYAQTSFGYDAAFRAISFANGADVSPGSYVRQFDNENHTIAQSATAVSTGNSTDCQDYNLAYNWGPAGHPVLLGGSASLLHFAPMVGGCVGTATPAPIQQESLHWDGSTLLFTTNSAGKLDDLKVDAAADFTPLDSLYTGVTFWDRSPDGTLLGCHSTLGSGAAAGAAYRTYTAHCIGTNGDVGPTMALGDGQSAVGNGGIIIQPGTDGYSDGYNVIQGVRAFDPGLGSFTTPDAYAGDIKDPVSQKPFIWDHNNPIVYSDPTGYNSEENDEARLLGIRGFNSRTMDSIRKALGLSNDEKLPKFPENANKLNHTFNDRPGHVPDTPLNRVLIQENAANGKVVESGSTSNGGTYTVRATLLQNGKEVWSQTYTNSSGQTTISNGGIGAPKYLDPSTGQPVSTNK